MTPRHALALFLALRPRLRRTPDLKVSFIQAEIYISLVFLVVPFQLYCYFLIYTYVIVINVFIIQTAFHHFFLSES